jgi:hypothetical protein
MKRNLAGWLMMTLAVIVWTSSAYALPVDGNIFYTTFGPVAGFGNSGQFANFTVWQVEARYTGNGTAGNGTFSLLNDTGIALTGSGGFLSGDGIVANPNNKQLLVSGQSNAVFQVNPTTGVFTTAIPNIPAAFHLVVDPSKNVVWAAGLPGNLSSLPINPFGGAGTIKVLSGSDPLITSMLFTPFGIFYTSSGQPGVGNFGTIDLGTGVTTRLLSNLPAAHGIQYDPFTGNLILGGSDEIAQIDPLNPTVILSSRLFPGNTFDQGAVDGLGHIFWADNNGRFFFMDYSTTGLVGNANNFVSNNFFKNSLDDIAPLIGEGGTKQLVPEPSTLLLLASGFAALGCGASRRLRRKQSLTRAGSFDPRGGR